MSHRAPVFYLSGTGNSVQPPDTAWKRLSLHRKEKEASAKTTLGPEISLKDPQSSVVESRCPNQPYGEVCIRLAGRGRWCDRIHYPKEGVGKHFSGLRKEKRDAIWEKKLWSHRPGKGAF